MDPATVADLAALLATVLATVGSLPQLRRVIVRGDGRGVSLSSAALGIGTELAWIGYAVDARLWSALPEAGLMVLANAALAVALVRRGAHVTPAVPAGIVWLALFGAVATIGGAGALAIMLAGAYAVQVAPAVWTVWRTASPTGVAGGTWAMLGLEGLLWGVYGMHHDDLALTWFAAVSMTAATATLARKLIVCRAGQTVVNPSMTARISSP